MVHKINLADLVTERLAFRELTYEDEQTLIPFFEDPECIQYYDLAWRIEDAPRLWIEKQINRYKNHGRGLWALIDKETGAFVGQCGLLDQEVNGKKELEVGYNLLKKNWGKGFATEAAISCRDFAFQNKLADSIISIIHVNNVNSQKVAIRNGIVKDMRAEFKSLPVYIYRINSQ